MSIFNVNEWIEKQKAISKLPTRENFTVTHYFKDGVKVATYNGFLPKGKRVQFFGEYSPKVKHLRAESLPNIFKDSTTEFDEKAFVEVEQITKEIKQSFEVEFQEALLAHHQVKVSKEKQALFFELISTFHTQNISLIVKDVEKWINLIK